jgi:hypothetical protein
MLLDALDQDLFAPNCPLDKSRLVSRQLMGLFVFRLLLCERKSDAKRWYQQAKGDLSKRHFMLLPETWSCRIQAHPCTPALFCIEMISSQFCIEMISSQLKRDGYVRRQIHCLAVASGRAEADQLGNTAGFFVQSMPQAMHYALDDDLPICRERYAQNYVALHSELARFCGVLHGRL